MHYRHHFHAGNFADVFKHLVLVALLDALNAKDKPWFFLDTHAGAGRYDLRHANAEATAEWHDGIGRLLADRDALPAPLARYLALAGDAAAYPGSPLLAAVIARAGDRLALCERVPAVAEQLDLTLRQVRMAATCKLHLRDGYEAAAALLPPAEKRGLVLVDPPFESPDEFDAIADFLKTAQARFAQGQCAVWYPVKKRFEADRFVRRVGRDSLRPVLDLRFETGAPPGGRMHCCGLLLVNPPWRLEQMLAGSFDLVARRLAQGPQSAITPNWIKTEDACARS